MSTPIIVKIVAENLTDEAGALAAGEGWRREVEVEAGAVRHWLENFAALPALDTEDVDARLHLHTPTHRLVVRRAGGRLGTEEGGTFVPATVDEILSSLLAGPSAASDRGTAVEPVPLLGARPKVRVRAQGWLLAGLLSVFALLYWWGRLPETPDGVEWVDDAAERQTILTQAAGSYASENERVNIDTDAHLIASNEAGEETLRTSLRVGRRAGVPVLVTEAGVLFEVTTDDSLRLGDSIYKPVR